MRKTTNKIVMVHGWNVKQNTRVGHRFKICKSRLSMAITMGIMTMTCNEIEIVEETDIIRSLNNR